MDLESALRQPRIDISLLDTIVADDRLAAATFAALAAVAAVRPAQGSVFPSQWAIPNVVAFGTAAPTGAAPLLGPLPAAVGTQPPVHQPGVHRHSDLGARAPAIGACAQPRVTFSPD